MAHFYGIANGQAETSGTRRGSKKSGLRTTAASYQGAVKVVLEHNETDGLDYAEVRLMPWQGHGTDALLYSGPVGKAQHHENSAVLMELARTSDNDTVQSAYRNLLVALRLAHPGETALVPFVQPED